eukprot:207206-Pyramimonas_sp.AAC.1
MRGHAAGWFPSGPRLARQPGRPAAPHVRGRSGSGSLRRRRKAARNRACLNSCPLVVCRACSQCTTLGPEAGLNMASLALVTLGMNTLSQ